jgi:hypothetical protein
VGGAQVQPQGPTAAPAARRAARRVASASAAPDLPATPGRPGRSGGPALLGGADDHLAAARLAHAHVFDRGAH